MFATMLIGVLALLLAVLIGAFLDLPGEGAGRSSNATRQTMKLIGSVP